MEEPTTSREIEVMGSDSSVLPLKVLSPEDLAWADSCLADDLESSTGWDSWSSLSSALNEVTNTRHSTSRARLSGMSFPSGDLSTSQPSGERVDEIFMSNEETQEYGGSPSLMSEDFGYMRNVFLPTYREDSRDERIKDSESSSVMGRWKEESESREEIFKVWNLDIPAEDDHDDDEFLNELNKAFSESPLELPSPKLQSPKGLEESIDAVIDGMAYLTLENRVDI